METSRLGFQVMSMHFDDGARYPGQRSAECEIERTRLGIPLEPNAMRVLVEAGELVGYPFDLDPLTELVASPAGRP
jgi:hypothetical protein